MLPGQRQLHLSHPYPASHHLPSFCLLEAPPRLLPSARLVVRLSPRKRRVAGLFQAFPHRDTLCLFGSRLYLAATVFLSSPPSPLRHSVSASHSGVENQRSFFIKLGQALLLTRPVESWI
ncbi:hypothetical protein ACOSQ2_024295 [Xanthoceras sorbifolium]